MNFQGLNFHFSVAVLMCLVGCASTSSVSTNTEVGKTTESVSPAATVAAAAAPQAPIEITQEAPKRNIDNSFLICKASRNRIHFDWSAGSLAAGQGLIDQNNVRYEFRSASKPAGARGENLKVGECGWAAEALADKAAPKNRRQQMVFKSLSDEATQTFYKMKTGKVFKVPVRQTKNGLVATPGGVSVIR